MIAGTEVSPKVRSANRLRAKVQMESAGKSSFEDAEPEDEVRIEESIITEL